MIKRTLHWGLALLLSLLCTFQTVVLIFNVTHPELTTAEVVQHGWDSAVELVYPVPIIGETMKKVKDVVD